jgi:hypothetical protein
LEKDKEIIGSRVNSIHEKRYKLERPSLIVTEGESSVAEKSEPEVKSRKISKINKQVRRRLR